MGRPAKSPERYVEQDCGYATPCRIWQRATTSHGYGVERVDGRLRGAHVIEWEKENGPVPKGMDLDHLCRQKPCVRPDHLEPVTRRENIRRGIKGVLTTHCPQGHAYDSQNTYITPSGHRRCRACRRIGMRRSKA